MAFISPKGQGQTRSGRFTAPPAAGAFGGSDGAMQKLGRPFIPKPFTGSGGLSAGADTMMSMAMGRHNVQQDLDVEEMIDISALSTRKVDKRLSTKQGLKMKKYLHDLNLVDMHNTSDNDIERLYEGLQDYLGSVLSKIEPYVGYVAPYVPFGDLYFGYRATKSIRELKDVIEKFSKHLSETFKVEFNLYDEDDNDIAQIVEKVSTLSSEESAGLKADIISIGMINYDIIKDLLMSIPGEILGPVGAKADMVIDTLISASSFANDEEVVKGFIESSDKMKMLIDTIRSADGVVEAIESFLGTNVINLNGIANLFSNLGKIYHIVSSNSSEGIILNVQAPVESGLDIFAESRRKKKKLQKQDEMNVAGNIAGYTGPLSGPANPKDFYKRMSKAYHGEFLNKPSKIKGKP